MKLRSALLASAMLALPLTAVKAQPVNGLYMGGGVGLNFMQREQFDISGKFAGGPNSKAASGDVRVDLGFAGVISLGWGFGNGLRAEGEFSYRANNNFNNPSGYGFPGTASGQEQKMGGMVNVLYDFVGVAPWVQPYIGAGVGYQSEKLSGFHITPLNVPTGAGAQTTSKGSFAYQAILGLAIPIVQAPGLAITTEYRFMGMTGSRSFPAAANLGAAVNAISESNYNHSLLVGVRYNFGQAPAPAAPMPVADMGAKTFLVFFDWDKANLTPRSEGIVRDAATYSTRSQYTRIDVDGNTDTSGTPSYNQGLSERRARVVAAELVRDGVPQNVISMHAYGDTHLLVPTGPNVREPQNRRVEIVFH